VRGKHASPGLPATNRNKEYNIMSEIKVTKKPGESEFSLAPLWEHAPWNISPFSLMRRFSDELERMFGNGGAMTSLRREAWAPAVEVEQHNGMLKVKADLPGMKQEDITVEASADGLIIQGERREQHEEKKEGYYRSERSYGKFYRMIPLPEGAELDKAKAEYTNGVLEVAVPVPQAKKQDKRQIPIQAKAA
jgi:HSP20 family protein